MLVQVFIDMKNFLIVLLISIFALSLIDRQLNRATDDPYSTKISFFYDALDATYDLGFGNFSEEKSKFSWSFYFYFVINSVLFSLVMFNFLIAIISDTYARVSEKKEYYSLQEIISVLSDYSHFKQSINCCLRRKSSYQYLHIIQQKEEASSNFLQFFNFLDLANQLEEKLENLFKTLKKELSDQKSEDRIFFSNSIADIMKFLKKDK